MKRLRTILLPGTLVVGSIFVFQVLQSNPALVNAASAPAANSWYFAVSGDSRDCGDVVMPRIAKSIADNRSKSVISFYWHLGDLRAIYRVDCDMAKRLNPLTRCAQENSPELAKNDLYVASAWLDYVANQIRPFEKVGVPFVLGIGNHETISPKTKVAFQKDFKEWLTQDRIQQQRERDRSKGIPSNDGDTYFHFIEKNVDFIYLDNSDPGDRDSHVPDPTKGFSKDQLEWLGKVLQSDLATPSVKTLVVGMHAALPFGRFRDHAMDDSCSSLCSGIKAYNLMAQAKAKGKKVYVFASHSHYFQSDIYNTPEHQGNVLPGWIVGTGGAEQYQQQIRYGYLRVTVKPDGSLLPEFVDVGRESHSVVPLESPELLDYCFEKNKETETATQKRKDDPKNRKDQTYCQCPS